MFKFVWGAVSEKKNGNERKEDILKKNNEPPLHDYNLDKLIHDLKKDRN